MQELYFLLTTATGTLKDMQNYPWCQCPAHLCLSPCQNSDVTEPCDVTQLWCHSHHSSLPLLLTCQTETDHHGLLIVFPFTKYFPKALGKNICKIIKCYLIQNLIQNTIYYQEHHNSINLHVTYLYCSSRLCRSVWKSLRSLISSGASLYCCRSSWITELRSAARFCLLMRSFSRSVSVMSPSVYVWTGGFGVSINCNYVSTSES